MSRADVRGRCIWLAGAAILVLAGTAPGAELRARAPVVDVVPLGAPSSIPACEPPRPSGIDLAALLAWDLRLDCPAPAAVATGYRVFYRWDGRTYSRVMAEHPGDSVPVRVRLD
ncbi:MAG: hypothetical protein RIC56_05190 [Pseudomonadales bacterium]